MLYLISLVLIVLSLIKKKSKVVTGVLLIFFWILFGWSYGNADYGIYLGRYNNYDGYIFSMTEPLFTSMMEFFNKFNFSYEQFLIIISAIILSVYCFFVKKNTQNINYVLILYFIYPFCMDVCQLRFTIACSIVYIGLIFLLKEDEKHSIIKYAIFVTIAGMIHYSVLFYYILILAKILNNKKSTIFTIICIILLILFVSIFTNIQINGTSTLINKINYVLASASIKYNYKNILKVECYALIFYFGYYILNKMIIKKLKENFEINKEKIYFCDFVMRINTIILIIFPLCFYTVDLYRLQTGLSLLNYISFSYYLVDIKKFRTINKKNVFFISITMIYVFINLYLLVLGNSNINTVFKPLFENNLLL